MIEDEDLKPIYKRKIDLERLFIWLFILGGLCLIVWSVVK
jgi:hypothetical protein